MCTVTPLSTPSHSANLVSTSILPRASPLLSPMFAQESMTF
jgi:hypothetical protein